MASLGSFFGSRCKVNTVHYLHCSSSATTWIRHLKVLLWPKFPLFNLLCVFSCLTGLRLIQSSSQKWGVCLHGPLTLFLAGCMYLFSEFKMRPCWAPCWLKSSLDTSTTTEITNMKAPFLTTNILPIESAYISESLGSSVCSPMSISMLPSPPLVGGDAILLCCCFSLQLQNHTTWRLFIENRLCG